MERTAYDEPTEDPVQCLLPQHVKRALVYMRSQRRREDHLAGAGSHVRGTRTHAAEAVQDIRRALAAGLPAPAPSQSGSQRTVASRLRDRHFRDRHKLRLHSSRAVRHGVSTRLRRVAVSDQAARARQRCRRCIPACPGRLARQARAAACALPDRDAAGGTRNPRPDGTPGRNPLPHAHRQRHAGASVPRPVVRCTAAARWRHPLCPDGPPEAGR